MNHLIPKLLVVSFVSAYVSYFVFFVAIFTIKYPTTASSKKYLKSDINEINYAYSINMQFSASLVYPTIITHNSQIYATQWINQIFNKTIFIH